MSKALVCLYHRSSSTGEYSLLVLFLTNTGCVCSGAHMAGKFVLETLGGVYSWVKYGRTHGLRILAVCVYSWIW